MPHFPFFLQRPACRKQRGIAALEFTILALFVMVPAFLGVFVFWEVLQTQQVITRATGDGARQVSRMLNTARAKNPDGSFPSNTQARNTAAALARASISATLRSHLGSDVDSRLTVDLQPAGTDQLALNVTYARPALLGAAGGLNFIEPQTLQARSLINGH